MPRKANRELKIRCCNCKEFTSSIEPIIINNVKENRVQLSCICSICNKTKYLNKAQIALLPEEVRSSSDNSVFVNKIERARGLIPLLALIPAIAAGVTA